MDVGNPPGRGRFAREREREAEWARLVDTRAVKWMLLRALGRGRYARAREREAHAGERLIRERGWGRYARERRTRASSEEEVSPSDSFEDVTARTTWVRV